MSSSTFSEFYPISCLCLRFVMFVVFSSLVSCFFVLSCPDVKTFGLTDLDEQRKQINGICVLFIIVAVISFFSQFLQVSIQFSSCSKQFLVTTPDTNNSICHEGK